MAFQASAFQGFQSTSEGAGVYSWDTKQGVTNFYKFHPVQSGRAKVVGVAAGTAVGVVTARQRTWDAHPHSLPIPPCPAVVGVVTARASARAKAKCAAATKAKVRPVKAMKAEVGYVAARGRHELTEEQIAWAIASALPEITRRAKRRR